MENAVTTAAANSSYPPAATVLYNADPLLLRALLAALTTSGRTVYLYINGLASPDVEAVLAVTPNARLIRSAENVGLGAALNAVMAAAKADGFCHLLLFDQDSTPPVGLPEWLLRDMEELERAGHKIAAVGPRLLPPSGSHFLPIKYWWRAARADEPPGAVEFLPTSGSLLSLEAWQQIGPFRADYFIGGIDVDWGLRAWSQRFASVVARDIAMDHRWGDEAKPGVIRTPQIARQGPVRMYFYVRNAVDGLTLPHMPWRWKWRQCMRMAAQIGLLMTVHRSADIPPSLIARAIADGWKKSLGPFPPDLKR